MKSLEKLALFRFDGDFTVVPRDSAWFGAVDTDGLHSLNETDLYKVGARSILLEPQTVRILERTAHALASVVVGTSACDSAAASIDPHARPRHRDL